MHKLFKIFLLFVIVALSSQLNAQQIPVNYQYSINPYILSPAYAGYDELVNVFIDYRKEWGNIKGSPQTSFVNGFMPISQNAWIGGQVISDQADILQLFYGQLSYTYHLKINNQQFLHFAMWGSLFQSIISLDNLIISDPLDPLLMGKTKMIGTSFNTGASLVYQYLDGNIGVTVPYMIKEKEAYIVQSINNVFVLERMAIFHINYNFRLNYDLELQPFVVYRLGENKEANFEFSARLRYRDNYWMGLMFRSEGKIGVNFGGIFTDNLLFNYSYEFATGGIVARPSPTHEFTLGFILPTGKNFNKSKWRRYLKIKGDPGYQTN